jgi:hypothetical protein
MNWKISRMACSMGHNVWQVCFSIIQIALWLNLPRLYFQNQFHRLPACIMPVHALLHLANDIRWAGPVWCYLAFPMEWYCGLLANSCKSRRAPFISLSHRIHDLEVLKQIKLKSNLTDVLNLDKAVMGAGQAYPQCMSLHGYPTMLPTCYNQILTLSWCIHIVSLLFQTPFAGRSRHILSPIT